MRTVKEYKCTCSACPTQYEGTLDDGTPFYFRFRWGHATLRLNPWSDNEELIYSEQISDGLDGFMEEDKVLELINNAINISTDDKGNSSTSSDS
jgi:hypothetical protein